MDFIFSGVVSAFALMLALAGTVPFVLVLLDWRNARWQKSYVAVMNGMTVLYLYFAGGLALTALGGWVLAVQTAASNVTGLAMCGALAFVRYRKVAPELLGLFKRQD